MTVYDQMAVKIIKEQEQLIGPVAWSQAGKVKGLQIIDKNKGSVVINNKMSGDRVVDSLVSCFEGLFGKTGREVCKDAVRALIADLQPSQIPSSLK
jgi:calcineurin-like phosphoesterase